jgi:phosphatidylserine/phosphatidylglycerophosphate/cardiolipin synthase-like enzyme
MPGFDIEWLLRFAPPEYLCARCCALLSAADLEARRCPTCETLYVATAHHDTVESYLAAHGLHVPLVDPMARGRDLAQIARRLRTASDYPPMRALLEAFAGAERFIHFTTYGVSALLLGAVKLAAQRVAVRGVVSGVKDAMCRELTDYPEEAPLLHTRVFGQDAWFPHQKIVVIDGLLAFKGSANLTDFGWRKAAHGREVLEVVTDTREVLELHNRYFSGAWAAFEETEAGRNSRIMMV